MPTSTMRSPLAATVVAEWFLERVADEQEQDLSNLKLQKLVYLAHSLYLHRFHMPLIEDEVQAWENGPAVKPLYGKFKSHGAAPIRKLPLNIPQREWPERIDDTLCDVWAYFGGYSASKLRTITHEAGPWKDHWRLGVRDTVIPVGEIADAWPDFENYAEAPIVARSNNTTASLARYRSIRHGLPKQDREGDMDLLLAESSEHELLRRRASSLQS